MRKDRHTHRDDKEGTRHEQRIGKGVLYGYRKGGCLLCTRKKTPDKGEDDGHGDEDTNTGKDKRRDYEQK